MTQLTDDSDRTTYSRPTAQSESVVSVAATRQLEQRKACKQPTYFGDGESEKNTILFCRQTESEPLPDLNVKKRAAGRNRIRGEEAADRLQHFSVFGN